MAGDIGAVDGTDLVFEYDETSPQVLKSQYYDIDEFNSVCEGIDFDQNLSVLNINARSLVNHINELSAILDCGLIKLKETFFISAIFSLQRSRQCWFLKFCNFYCQSIML